MSGLSQQMRSRLDAISSDLHNAVQREIADLRLFIDQRIAAIEATVRRTGDAFDQLASNVQDLASEEAQMAATDARERAEAAGRSEMTALQARLQAEVEAARVEFELVRTALETQLSESERDIAAIRRNRDDHALSLDDARQRITALQAAHVEMKRLRQVTDARLEEEVQRRTTVAKQLEAAREEIRLAKAEADSCRLEAHLTGERVQALEGRLHQLEQSARPLPSASAVILDEPSVLNHLKQGLDRLGRVKGEELLSRLLEQLGDNFAATAVFTVESQRLRLWKCDVQTLTAAALATPPVSLDDESPLARAYRHRTTVSVDVSSTGGALGLWQTPLGHAIALPVLAHGRVVALAYVENPPGQSDARLQMLETVAEILVGYVNHRLNRSQPAGELPSTTQQANPTPPSTGADEDDTLSRKARRVKLEPPVGALVEGVASTLVNISALGAQIVSPSHLRLNRCVRIVVADDSSGLTCEGRIVWARLESAAAGVPVYRAGVRFTVADPKAVMTFISEHRSDVEIMS